MFVYGDTIEQLTRRAETCTATKLSAAVSFVQCARCSHSLTYTTIVVALQFISELITRFTAHDARIVSLLEAVEVHIMPSMNPDGYAKKQRENANGVDLNRNFPDHFRGDSVNDTTGDNRQPETVAVMQYIQEHKHIVLSANLHGGALCVNYPWDGHPNLDESEGIVNLSPDNPLFVSLSLSYSTHHPKMWNSTDFLFGLTNGAGW